MDTAEEPITDKKLTKPDLMSYVWQPSKVGSDSNNVQVYSVNTKH